MQLGPVDAAAIEKLLRVAGRSKATTRVDHWGYLFVRGALAAWLHNEDPRIKELSSAWLDRVADRCIAKFGAEAEGMRALVDAGDRLAVGHGLGNAIALGLPEALREALDRLSALHLPCACLAVDLWHMFIVRVFARLGLVGPGPAFPIGGHARTRVPSEPFTFRFDAGPWNVPERDALLAAYRHHLEAPPELPGNGPTPTHVKKLERWIGWYIHKHLQGASVRSLAREHETDESTVRYGLNEVARLFGLSLARIKTAPLSDPPGEKVLPQR
jgi:hypothetical protein